MKRNMKITIASMAVLLVMAIAATIASFSMADEPTREVEPLAAASGETEEVDNFTNVDYIIMNANDTTADDMVYHVVEIGSGTQGKFQDFFNDGNFAKYVLDGNKSASNDLSMDATKIEYHYFNVSELQDSGAKVVVDEATQKKEYSPKFQTIAKADFIYVSNINNAFSSTNDMGEELYNLLHTYAIGDYKPLIIDSPNAGSGGNGGNGGGGNGGGGNSGGSTAPTNATISTVVTDYYAPSGVYNGTYEWNTATPADTFLAGGLNETKYIGVNSKTAQKNWIQLYNEPDAELTEEQKNDPEYLTRAGRLAKILVVSKDGSAGSLAGTLTASATAVDLTIYYTNSDNVTAAYAGGNTYGASQTLKNIYSSRYSYRPDFVQLDGVAVSAFADADIDGYDMIVIEPDCAGEAISQAAYDRFVAAMKSKMRIVYDSSLNTTGSTQGSGNSGGTTGNDDAGTGDVTDSDISRYHQLYYMVATADGLASYPNIMPTSASTVNMMATSKSASICKPIADLINNSSYRGIGGPAGSSSNVFTVLEIQPAYPIDLGIAAAQGTYYKEGANMAPSGMTKEQIADGKEYYAWEISEAKIADALGLDYDEVKVVHMSVEEFAASHTELVGNYDMVFLGNNRSALRDGSYSYCAVGEPMVYKGFSFLGSGGEGYKDVAANRTDIFYSLDNYNGRDLSTYNVTVLNAFVNAGMPVVVSKSLTQAYTVNGVVASNSKMSAFLGANISKANVLSDFDVTDVTDSNGAGLGNTLTGVVSVFSQTVGDQLRTFKNSCTKRLTLAVTKRPAQYNLYDKTTVLTSSKLDFKFEVNVPNYTAKLYIDSNGNGAYDEAPVVTKNNPNGVLSFNLADQFDPKKGGTFYWKLEVSNSGSAACATGAAYLKPTDKKDVSVLQIVPDKSAHGKNYGAQGQVSLIFCTECQRAMMPLKWNPMVSDPWSDSYYSYKALYMGQDNVSNFGNGDGSNNPWGSPVNNSNGMIQYSSATPVYIGKHEHKFGIVKFGGSEVYGDDCDDWDWNFADELSDMYNFHIDVLYSREYEALDARIKKDYASLVGNEAELTAAQNEVAAAKSALDAYIAGDYATACANVETSIAYIRDNGVVMYNTVQNLPNLKRDMQRLIDEDCYYDFFSSFGKVDLCNAALASGGMKESYEAWAKANDTKIDLRAAYMEALYKYNFLKSGGKDWLSGSYSTVVIGAAENFGNDDIKSGDDVLKAYCDNGGQVIMFHECMGRLSDYSIAAKITAAVKDAAGLKSYSDTQMQSETYGNTPYYKYARLRWDKVAFWNCNADYTVIEQKGTNQAILNNRCSVNTFPFTLSDKLKITGTHPVGFALDTDKLDVTPLYSLTTSTVDNEYQTIYPASPADGSDNYFIYRSGNFYYCGAGHSKVTGKASNNNDERRLYINIICNSVEGLQSVPIEPSIDVFDYTAGKIDETTGKPVEKNDFVKKNGDDGYIYELDEDDDIPEFSFKVTTDTGVTIQSIDIYYKLDSSFLYETDEEQLKNKLHYSSAKGDKMIVQGLKSTPGAMNDIDADKYAGLKLTQEMFDAYGGNYTYIVIAVTDSAGNTSFQKIKITRKTHLFDLT